MRHTIATAAVSLLFAAGCGPSGSEEQAVQERDSLAERVSALEQEMSAYRDSVAYLNNTPHERLARAGRYREAGDLGRSEKEYLALVEQYPDAGEAVAAQRAADEITQEQERARQEEERRRRLKFQVLEESREFSAGPVTVRELSTKVSDRWIMDRYGSRYRYREAERGNDYVYSNVRISSETNRPDLPALYVYYVDDGKMKSAGQMKYEFYRWEDYGSYLGNTADYSNDFSRNESVLFTAGLEVRESVLEQHPVFVMGKHVNCASRQHNSYETPEVYYSMASCNGNYEISLDEAERWYTPIEIINENAFN